MNKKLTIQTDGKYLDQAQTGQPNKCKESRAGPSPIRPPSKQAEKSIAGPPPNWTTKQAAEKNKSWTKIQASNPS